MSELRGLGAVNERLKAAGGAVLAIAADAPADSRKIARRHGLTFDLLCDEGAKTIAAFGLVHRDPFRDINISLPANYLIDREGRVAWRWIGRRVQDRPDPAEVLRQVDALLGRFP